MSCNAMDSLPAAVHPCAHTFIRFVCIDLVSLCLHCFPIFGRERPEVTHPVMRDSGDFTSVDPHLPLPFQLAYAGSCGAGILVRASTLRSRLKLHCLAQRGDP